MKKTLTVTLIIIITLLSIINVAATDIPANTITASTQVIELDDGSRLILTLKEDCYFIDRAGETYIRTGEVSCANQATDGSTSWEYILHASYIVSAGLSATCTEHYTTYTIYNDAWSLDSSSNSHNDNIAEATATFKKKALFITLDTDIIELSLSCDSNGVLTPYLNRIK